MADVVWTEPALDDLSEIAEYIALDNLDAAKRLVRTVFDTVQRLEGYPKSGKRPAELPGSSYRELVVPPCRVFYRMEDDAVFIVYVMRSERQLRRYLLDQRT
jgi:toxin ParE1/3/4